jgi:hypothetical protein
VELLPKNFFSKRDVKIFCQLLQSIWAKPLKMRRLRTEDQGLRKKKAMLKCVQGDGNLGSNLYEPSRRLLMSREDCILRKILINIFKRDKNKNRFFILF